MEPFGCCRIQIFSEKGKDCAIGIPISWQANIKDINHKQRSSQLLLDRTAIISTHFPHNQSSHISWHETLDGIESQLNKWQSNYDNIILGTDLNMTLPKEMHGITGCLVEPRPVKHIERLDEFIRFAAKFKLRASQQMIFHRDQQLGATQQVRKSKWTTFSSLRILQEKH